MVPFRVKKVEKTWGHELWLANNETENYCAKILFIKKNKSTSMHYHVKKHETMHVLKGTLMVEGLGDRHNFGHKFAMMAKEGESLEIERGRAHKLVAHHEDLTIIEASTFHRDKDSYRLHK
tara:strand:- start:5008 stop:5370 length:363 start_codon:yes stop_codon:yes gene_type:complete